MFAVSRETANIKNNKMPHISSNKNKIDAIQQNQRNTTPFDGQHNGIAQKNEATRSSITAKQKQT